MGMIKINTMDMIKINTMIMMTIRGTDRILTTHTVSTKARGTGSKPAIAKNEKGPSWVLFLFGDTYRRRFLFQPLLTLKKFDSGTFGRFKVLSGKRWELLNAMTGAGAMSIREAARRVERDVKAVHGDVTALLNAGLLSKTDDGMIVFPFDAIHVDFMLKAA
jgi:hypothetical protein